MACSRYFHFYESRGLLWDKNYPAHFVEFDYAQNLEDFFEKWYAPLLLYLDSKTGSNSRCPIYRKTWGITFKKLPIVYNKILAKSFSLLRFRKVAWFQPPENAVFQTAYKCTLCCAFRYLIFHLWLVRKTVFLPRERSYIKLP